VLHRANFELQLYRTAPFCASLPPAKSSQNLKNSKRSRQNGCELRAHIEAGFLNARELCVAVLTF
jgi:hypothetical protein